MDLRLYARVLWRFRLLTVCGLLLATLLAFLSYVNVGFANGKPTLTYRDSQQWASYTKLFVTQKGFPWGYSDHSGRRGARPDGAAVRASTSASRISRGSRTSPFSTRSWRRVIQSATIMREDGPVRGTVMAAPVLALNNPGNPLPIISLAGVSTSPAQARSVTTRATAAIQEYLRRQQESNDIPAADRVQVQVLEAPRAAQLFQGRSKTLPIIVFLALITVTAALAFVLENVRPAARPVIAPADETAPAVRARRYGLVTSRRSSDERRAPAVRDLLPALRALAVLAAAVAAPRVPLLQVVPVIVAASPSAALTHRTLLAWRVLLPFLLLTILFVPIRRYAFPGNLPFELEPYRLVVLFIGLGWLASLLVDRTGERATADRPGRPDRPVADRRDRVHRPQPRPRGSDPGRRRKRLTFFLSFLLISYVIVSLVRPSPSRTLLVKTLVVGGAIVAAFSMLEARTGYNIFNHLAERHPDPAGDRAPGGPRPRGTSARLRLGPASDRARRDSRDARPARRLPGATDDEPALADLRRHAHRSARPRPSRAPPF